MQTRTILLALLALTLVVGGCSRSDEAKSGGSPPGAQQSDSDADDDAGDTGGDPCTLLSANEVEAAIGPLAGPPYREGNNGVDADGSRCIYDTRDLRSLKVDVTWADGASIMRMLGTPAAMADKADLRGKLPLPDGVTMTGEWDEARITGCCDISALRGDQLVQMNFVNTRLTTQQGVDLLNAALRRLDAPLKDIDGTAGNAAAERRQASREGRPKIVPACELVTVDDAKQLLGDVEVLPVSNNQGCQYRKKQGYGLIDFRVAWERGYMTQREESDMAGKVMKGLMGDMAKDPKDVKVEEYPGPWEQASVVAMSFCAVRKDVRMCVDIRGTSLANAQAAVTRAMGRVSWPP